MGRVIWILLLVIMGLIGYIIGFSMGVAITIDKAINAVNILFDVDLSPGARAIISSFPAVFRVITGEDAKKLGLNYTEYKKMSLNELNQSLIKSSKLKYGNYE